MLEKYLTSLKPEETILVRSRDWPCHRAWHGQEYAEGKGTACRGVLPCRPWASTRGLAVEGDRPGICMPGGTACRGESIMHGGGQHGNGWPCYLAWQGGGMQGLAIMAGEQRAGTGYATMHGRETAWRGLAMRPRLAGETTCCPAWRGISQASGSRASACRRRFYAGCMATAQGG